MLVQNHAGALFYLILAVATDEQVINRIISVQPGYGNSYADINLINFKVYSLSPQRSPPASSRRLLWKNLVFCEHYQNKVKLFLEQTSPYLRGISA